MDKSSENSTREQVKQRIADEITKVREVINTEMENIRKIQGADNKSLDRDKIYFFDKEGREIKTTGELGGEVEGKKYSLLEKNIPEGTAKIVTAGDLSIDKENNGLFSEGKAANATIIAGGSIRGNGVVATLIAGGNIDTYGINRNSGALGDVRVSYLGKKVDKIVAGADISFRPDYLENKVEVLAGNNIFVNSDIHTRNNLTKNEPDINLLAKEAIFVKPYYYREEERSEERGTPAEYVKYIKASADKAYTSVYARSDEDIKFGDTKVTELRHDKYEEELKKTTAPEIPSSEVRDPMVLRSGRAHSLENIDLPITSRAR